MMSWTVMALTSCSTESTDGDSPKEPTFMEGVCSNERVYKECVDKCKQEAAKCSDACVNATWTRIFCNSNCTLHEVLCYGRCASDNDDFRLPISCKSNTIEA